MLPLFISLWLLGFISAPGDIAFSMSVYFPHSIFHRLLALPSAPGDIALSMLFFKNSFCSRSLSGLHNSPDASTHYNIIDLGVSSLVRVPGR